MDIRQRLDLADIPGLGPVRRDALAEAGIVDLPGLLAMKVSELGAVRGIGLWQARKIREFLRQRGLLVEDGRAEVGTHDTATLVIRQPETVAQAEAVAEVVAVIEAQAAVEARVEAEIELLTEALEAAHGEDGGSVQDTELGASSEDTESGIEGQELEIAADAADADPGDTEADAEEQGGQTGGSARELLQDLQARRERLPELALTLIEAIRQAAVNKQLTRQVTRLLITSGEFTSARNGGTEQLAAAAEALAQAEELLQRALEKEAFSEKAQKELADRIRKRRKSLDRLLEKPEVED
jgi:hypothetical protein